VEAETQKFTRWDLVDHLNSNEDVALYLDACLDEDPGDGMLVRAAFSDIARAQGMAELARAMGITHEGLYKALSPAGNPEFSTILKVIKGLKIKRHAAPERVAAQSAWCELPCTSWESLVYS
jgi:probable addiction module antidote protein